MRQDAFGGVMDFKLDGAGFGDTVVRCLEASHRHSTLLLSGHRHVQNISTSAVLAGVACYQRSMLALTRASIGSSSIGSNSSGWSHGWTRGLLGCHIWVATPRQYPW